MRPFTETLPFDRALALALAAVTPIAGTEVVSVESMGANGSETLDGRVAAEPVFSPMDVPPFDRSAMDGYAVRSADCTAPGAQLRVVGRVFTGEVFPRVVGPGECVEIATGAPMPAGTDASVMVEDTTRPDTSPDTGRDTALVSIGSAVVSGQHIGRRAADIERGAAVVRPGDVFTPSRVGALAAVGVRTAVVYRKPTVAIVSTGNEVVPPGIALPPGHIYDVNRFTLSAVVHRHGGVAVPLGSPLDTFNALEETLRQAAAHDLVVFSGGSSVGDRDLVRDVIEAHGRMIFHGIAVKPGKPTACARLRRPDGTEAVMLGMPGNPTSCLSNAYILLVPMLRALARLPAWAPRTLTVPLARDIRSASDRHQFYTVRVVDGAAVPAFKGSGDITSMADADGYIEIPAHVASLARGEHVRVVLF